jgi:hypothetical protein
MPASRTSLRWAWRFCSTKWSKDDFTLPISIGRDDSGMTSLSYDDTSPNVEYSFIKVKSIPWSSFGEGKLTIKFAL